MRGLWKTGLWKTFVQRTGWIIISKKLWNFKGFDPVDNLINLLEKLHLFRQGFVACAVHSTRFMVLDRLIPRFFIVSGCL